MAGLTYKATCKQCGGDIVWKRVSVPFKRSRPLQAFELDGTTVHWDTCSKRRWEQTKSTGERFETAQASGYANSVHGTKFDHLVAPSSGKKLPPCAGCVPPWEICPNRCAAEFAQH